MAKQTQERVFRTIRRNADARKRRDEGPYSKEVISGIMKDLSSSELREDRYFYYQDEEGLPVGKVSITVDGVEHFCTLTRTNQLNPTDWRGKAKDVNFSGTVWPPRKVEYLIGRTDLREPYCGCHGLKFCACETDETKDDIEDCNCPHRNCDYDYENCSKSCDAWWPEAMALRPVEGLGHGEFARQALTGDDPIGELTGQIVPAKKDADLLEGEDAYHSHITIGMWNSDDEAGQPKAWIDALHTGSIVRFINHSCEPNTNFYEGRVGMKRRMVYVDKFQEIEEGEQVTIDYGEKWFGSPDHPCLCGSANCKNPPRKANERPGNKDIQAAGGEEMETTDAKDAEMPRDEVEVEDDADWAAEQRHTKRQRTHW
jgi:hypothetical protein